MSHSDSEINRPRTCILGKSVDVNFKHEHLAERSLIFSNDEVKKHRVSMKSKFRRDRLEALKLKFKIRSLHERRLLVAAANNNTECLQQQLALGASPNIADIHGRSALHIAASKGYTDVVKLLLEHGADPNQRDKLHNTPLHLVACTHNLSIISLLLKAGADVRKLDVYGKNPIQLAQSKLQLLQRSWREGSVEMIQVRAELQLIVDILISVLEQIKTQETNVDDLQIMKLSLNSRTPENVDDQMSKLLSELQGITIS